MDCSEAKENKEERIDVGLRPAIVGPMLSYVGDCTLDNPKVRKLLDDAHERQVQLAKEGNMYAQAYLLRHYGYGWMIDNPNLIKKKEDGNLFAAK